jgi:hypothetical protein
VPTGRHYVDEGGRGVRWGRRPQPVLNNTHCRLHSTQHRSERFAHTMVACSTVTAAPRGTAQAPEKTAAARGSCTSRL